MARRPFTRHSVEGVGAAILAVIGYVLCRTLFGFPMSGWLSSPAALSAGHLLAVAESLLLYGALLLLPVGLRMERFMNLPTAADPLALCCAAGAALLIAAVLRGLRRGNVAACLFCWSFAALLPASNIIPIYPSIADRQIFLGEHFLYLPLAALSMIAALSWHNASGSRDGPSRVMRVAGVLALVLLGTLTYVHNEYWRDELTFYERTLRRYPGSVRMSMNLGLLYARLGRFDESVALLSRVAERNPLSARAHCNLGSAYLKMGNYDLAARELGEALELDPKFAVARSELAFMAMSQGRTDEAIVHYRAAIGASPYLMDARLNLAVAYFKQERVEEAVRTLREALALDPMSLDARYFLAVILERQGRLDEAREEYRTILDHYPDCEPAAERFNKCTIPNPDNVNNIRDDGRD
jgi:tetratricopeptide (TPR) repeat protein